MTRRAATDPVSAELGRLLAPRSIALLGASSDPRKFGGRPLAALKRWGYEGELYVVNPRRPEIQGIPCVSRPEELPGGIDLAVVLLPADDALQALEACAERGFGAAAVFSGGFGEAGPAGRERQRRLRALTDASGMRLLGPNSPGFVNMRANVACSASAFAQRAEIFPGKISFAVQSGAIGGILMDRALERGIGVNALICTGNEADVGIGEILDWFVSDPDTPAVGLFLEGLGRDRRLADALARAREQGLGIAALKAGRSEQGRRAVASHTANIVGSDASFDALCASLGIVRAHGYDDLIEVTQLLAAAPRPGRRAAVVGASGGMNTLLADAGADRGIELPELAPETVAGIAQLTPDFGSADNPVDISSVILVEPERMGRALELLAADPGIDMLVVPIGDHPPELSERFARIVADASDRIETPLVLAWSAGPLSAGGIAEAGRRGLTVLTEPERCMWAIAAASAAADRPRPRPSGDGAQAPSGAAPVSEHQAKQLLRQAGIAVPRGFLLSDPAEAESRVEELGGVAVVKADCYGTVHKTEAGAIRVGVPAERAMETAAAVLAAARKSLGAERVRGVIVEQQLDPVAELVVSVSADQQVGPLVTVGIGGELVELLGDTVTRLAPVDEDEALLMIGELRGAALLEGFRGRPRGDARALAGLVARVSKLGAAWGEQLELIELNPVAVLTDDAVVLDAVLEVRASGVDGAGAGADVQTTSVGAGD